MANVKMKRIKVVFSEREMMKWPNQVILRQFHMVQKLKDKGIPLAGTQIHEGVFSGTLSISRDVDLNDELEHVFVWEGPDRPVPDDDEL